MKTNLDIFRPPCNYFIGSIRFIIFCIFLGIFLLPKLKAQGYKIGGQVIDITSGKPIEKAIIKIGGYFTKSDIDGKFSFEEIEEGIYELRIRQENYHEVIIPLAVDSDKATINRNLKFELIPLNVSNSGNVKLLNKPDEVNVYG